MVTEAEARRIRPMMSGIVALAVALVAAIGWYYVGRPDESAHPITPVEWKPFVDAGRADGKLLTLAPAELPDGWKARHAEYTSGVSPHWRLAMLTDHDRFVEVSEGRDTIADLIAAGTDGEAAKGADVEIAGTAWQSWTAGNDYVLARTLDGPDRNQENVIVHGSAPATEIRSFAATLEPSAR